MAGASLLSLIDDIASLLDDVAVLSKVAIKKTSGVLGDDLALNAQQVTGVDSTRELPVIWAVAKGSLINKAILVPSALLLSALLPAAITPLLMLGGLFLCFEGCEKLAHRWLSSPEDDAKAHAEHLSALANSEIDLVALEKSKIKGAIRTDFILSAEIIIISLGTLVEANFGQQVAVLVTIAIVMTIGVYGLVAGIVKLDDLGFHLVRQSGGARRAIGAFILRLAPRLLKFLSIAGTAAMFLVGGGILTHGLPVLHHAVATLTQPLGDLPQVGTILAPIVAALFDAAFGIIAGAICVLVFLGIKSLRRT